MRAGCRSWRATTSPRPPRWTPSTPTGRRSHRRRSLSKPYVVVSADVVVADDTATARHLASTYGHWVYSIRAGGGAAPYPDPDTSQPLTDEQRAVVEDRIATQFVGDPDEVADRLATLQRVTDADELVVTSVTHRHADRLRSPRADRQALGADRMTRSRRKAPQADSPGRALSRREQHHGVVGPRVGQPDRLRLVRPPGPHRRARACSTSSSSPRDCGCASTAAGSTTSTSSAGPTPSPCWRHWPRSPSASVWSAPSTPRSTNPSRWQGNSPRLDHLSDGRAGWNMVTSSDAFTGENFRRGGFLDHADRYRRAEEFITVAREFWDSWARRRRDSPIGQRRLRRPGPDPCGRTSRAAVRRPRRGDACRGRRRDIRSCCRPVTPPTAGRSAPSTPTRCSPCTRAGGGPALLRGRQGARGCRMAEIPTSSRSFPRRHSCSATRRRGGREGPAHPPSAGQPADRHRHARTGLAA